MNINLEKLINNYLEELKIEETINYSEDDLKNTEIKRLSEIKIKGDIKSTTEELYFLNLKVTGMMVLPCSISLEEVEFPFNFYIEEVLTEKMTEEENYIKIIDNSIDIKPLVWQNIVMEIPLKVVSPNIEKKIFQGEGWELIEEDQEKGF
ncbi:MAG: YceD family protein [Bacilli bacterium]|jgi:uncharacterized protein